MSVKACRQELPNKGVKLTALRAAAYAQNVRPSKHDATSGLAKRLDKRRGVDGLRSRPASPSERRLGRDYARKDGDWRHPRAPGTRSARHPRLSQRLPTNQRMSHRENAPWLAP